MKTYKRSLPQKTVSDLQGKEKVACNLSSRKTKLKKIIHKALLCSFLCILTSEKQAERPNVIPISDNPAFFFFLTQLVKERMIICVTWMWLKWLICKLHAFLYTALVQTSMLFPATEVKTESSTDLVPLVHTWHHEKS